jgi:hypothetical protein
MFIFLSRRILTFLTDSTIPLWVGIFYAILLGATVLSQTLFLQAYFHRQFVVGLRFRSAITGLVYRKVGFVLLFLIQIRFMYYLELKIIEYS